jgi:4-alpha-glucanotransferase
LGLITADVHALRDQFRIPGTRVLQFAFDGNSDNPYLTRNYVPNTVAYTGTHDNPTSRQWYEELPPYQQQNLWRYLNSPQRDSRGRLALDPFGEPFRLRLPSLLYKIFSTSGQRLE